MSTDKYYRVIETEDNGKVITRFYTSVDLEAKGVIAKEILIREVTIPHGDKKKKAQLVDAFIERLIKEGYTKA